MGCRGGNPCVFPLFFNPSKRLFRIDPRQITAPFAVEAVEQWKFQPATLKGEAVPVKATIEVNFKIK